MFEQGIPARGGHPEPGRFVEPQWQQPHRPAADERQRVEVDPAVPGALDEAPVEAGRREAVAVGDRETAQHLAGTDLPADLDGGHHRLVGRPAPSGHDGDHRLPADRPGEPDGARERGQDRLPGCGGQVHAAVPRGVRRGGRLEAADDVGLGVQRPRAAGLVDRYGG